MISILLFHIEIGYIIGKGRGRGRGEEEVAKYLNQIKNSHSMVYSRVRRDHPRA